MYITEDRSVSHHSCWLMSKMSPWVPGEHLRSGHLLAARRRANNFVFPLHLAVPVTFNSYQMYVFQLSSVDCFPIARTNSIAVKFLGGFLVLYLNKSVLGFLYYTEMLSIFLIAGAQRRVPQKALFRDSNPIPIPCGRKTR